MSSKIGKPATLPGPPGFTIVEIMVACVVVATALLGVYAVFKQSMEIEARASVSWARREAARAALYHLADAVERIVNVRGVPTLIGERTQDGGYSMTCFVGGQGGSAASKGRFPLQWRRYAWADAGEADSGGHLELQTIPMAGTGKIADIRNLQEIPQEELWLHVEPVVVASGLRQMSVRYSQLDDPASGWRNQWRGAVGGVAVRIGVKCGDEHVEQVVVPRANAPVLSLEGG